jgi:hypothetical protein
MKEPAQAIQKDICFNGGFIHKLKLSLGPFKTIPNPLKQLPAKI